MDRLKKKQNIGTTRRAETVNNRGSVPCVPCVIYSVGSYNRPNCANYGNMVFYKDLGFFDLKQSSKTQKVTTIVDYDVL